MKLPLDTVAKEIGAVASAAGFDAFVKQGEEFVEAFAGEFAVGIGAVEDVVERVRRRSVA
jgi:hypothetical protein